MSTITILVTVSQVLQWSLFPQDTAWRHDRATLGRSSSRPIVNTLSNSSRAKASSKRYAFKIVLTITKLHTLHTWAVWTLTALSAKRMKEANSWMWLAEALLPRALYFMPHVDTGSNVQYSLRDPEELNNLAAATSMFGFLWPPTSILFGT